jgi:hypothetical protein
MKLVILLAALLAFVPMTVEAQKPTAEQCKKDPKMKGCEKK